MSTMTRPNPFTRNTTPATPAASTGPAASDKQVAYLDSLTRQAVELHREIAGHGIDVDRHTASVTELEAIDHTATDRRAASTTIDFLRATIDGLRTEARVARINAAPAADAPADELEAGMYHRDGAIYKVQRAVHGSGRMYAKALDTATGRFDYAAGAIRRLTPGDRMTLEQAKEYGALYGMCVRCGATLTDEDSIERAIGPVCAEKI